MCLRVFATKAEQDAAMAPGSRRLLRVSVPSPVKTIERQLNPQHSLGARRKSRRLVARPPRRLRGHHGCGVGASPGVEARFSWQQALRPRVAEALAPTTLDIVGRVEKVLAAAHEVEVALPAQPSATQADAIADIRAQLDRLLPQGFVTVTGATHLGDLTRYLTAVGRRLERLPRDVNADRERMARLHAVQDAYDELRQALSPGRAAPTTCGTSRACSRNCG